MGLELTQPQALTCPRLTRLSSTLTAAAPSGRIEELLSSCGGARWTLATELVCAKRLMGTACIRRDVLLLLRDKAPTQSLEPTPRRSDL